MEPTQADIDRAAFIKRQKEKALESAAPDLLSALRFLLADYVAINGETLTGSSVPADMARAAIAKAEGVA